MRKFYESLQNSGETHVEYGSVVWNPKTKRDQRKLEEIQRRATKIIPRLTNLSYDERLRILGLPNLEYRRLRADMIQVFKIFKGFDRVNVNAFFEVAVDKRTRGHKYKIWKQRFHTTLRKYSFSCRVVDSWNGLPDYVVDAPSINSFKNRLNTYGKITQ